MPLVYRALQQYVCSAILVHLKKAMLAIGCLLLIVRLRNAFSENSASVLVSVNMLVYIGLIK